MKPWKEGGQQHDSTVEKEIESLSIRDQKTSRGVAIGWAKSGIGSESGRNTRETKVSTQRREITSVWHRQPRTILDEIGKQLAGNEA